jgi:hypothetical protein
MGILNHVLAEPPGRERPLTEFPIERHFQDGVIDREVSLSRITAELVHTIFDLRFLKHSHNILPNWYDE